MRLGSVSFPSVLVLTMALCGCSSRHVGPVEKPPLVRTVAAGAPDEAMPRMFTGSVRARFESDLSFRVGGQVVERLVNDGEHVRRGQALFRLDAHDYQLSARAAAAEVAAAKARDRFAQAERDRLAGLLKQGAASRSDAERAAAEADAAAEALRAARAGAEIASNQNRYATLVADADGVVTLLRADVGQVVAPGQPIVRVARDGRREVEVTLPESLGGLKAGAVAEVRFLTDGAARAQARLRELSGAADTVTRTFSARFALDQGTAPPLGSTATVLIPATGPAPATGISVSLSALSDRGQGSGLWVVDAKSSTVRWRRVSVASYGDDAARISDGIEPGDVVATLGVHILTDGQKVRLERRPNAVSAMSAAL